MKAIKKIKINCALAAFTLVVAGPVSAERVLRGASFAPLDTTWGAPFALFVEHVNKTGKGVLQIRPMGPDAMPATEQPNALRSGLLDIVATPPGMYKQIVPEANVQDLSNMTLAEQKASGGYDAIRQITRQRMGAELITTYGPGVNFHVYLNKNIDSVEDLKGVRVRSQPIFQPFFSSVGMTGTVVPIPEVYTALERGVVGGYGFAAWGVQDLGWLKQTKVRVEPGFYNVVINVLVNDKLYKSLSEEEKAVLDQSVAWFDDMLPEYVEQEAVKHRAAQDAAGIVAVDLGADFAKQAEDVYWQELANTSPENVAQLRPLLQK